MLNKLTILIDNIIHDITSLLKLLIFYFFYFFSKKYNFLKKNNELKGNFLNKKVFIIGKGPSINKYNLKKLSKETVIMVNRTFTHKDYQVIKPKFHLFVDHKMARGVWPLSYIDEVFKKNPDCNIFLNADWYYLNKFTHLRNHKQIYWIKARTISLLLFDNFSSDFTKIVSTGGTVIEHAIPLSVFLGSKDINILGVEGNGIAKLMCNLDSHYYGKDPDYANHNSLNFASDMVYGSRGIRWWYKIAEFLNKRNIKIYNLSKEGILDAYEYKDFDVATKQ